MSAQIWEIISKGLGPVLAAIGTGLAIWIGFIMNKWVDHMKKTQARKDMLDALVQRKKNADDADKAVQQLYPNEPNEVKAKLALEWAQHLNSVGGIVEPVSIPNTVSGIVSSNVTQTILNESSVVDAKKDVPKDSTPPSTEVAQG